MVYLWSVKIYVTPLEASIVVVVVFVIVVVGIVVVDVIVLADPII